jgi:hypothetical protein
MWFSFATLFRRLSMTNMQWRVGCAAALALGLVLVALTDTAEARHRHRRGGCGCDEVYVASGCGCGGWANANSCQPAYASSGYGSYCCQPSYAGWQGYSPYGQNMPMMQGQMPRTSYYGGYPSQVPSGQQPTPAPTTAPGFDPTSGQSPDPTGDLQTPPTPSASDRSPPGI